MRVDVIAERSKSFSKARSFQRISSLEPMLQHVTFAALTMAFGYLTPMVRLY